MWVAIEVVVVEIFIALLAAVQIFCRVDFWQRTSSADNNQAGSNTNAASSISKVESVASRANKSPSQKQVNDNATHKAERVPVLHRPITKKAINSDMGLTKRWGHGGFRQFGAFPKVSPSEHHFTIMKDPDDRHKYGRDIVNVPDPS